MSLRVGLLGAASGERLMSKLHFIDLETISWNGGEVARAGVALLFTINKGCPALALSTPHEES